MVQDDYLLFAVDDALPLGAGFVRRLVESLETPFEGHAGCHGGEASGGRMQIRSPLTGSGNGPQLPEQCIGCPNQIMYVRCTAPEI